MKQASRLLLLGSMYLVLFCCQNQPPQPLVTTPVQVPVSDTILPATYAAVPTSTRQIYTLENLPSLLLHFKNLHFDKLCLKEKEMPDDPRKTWCLTCKGDIAVQFNDQEADFETPILQIGQDKINLKNLHFQPTGGFMDTVGNYLYGFGCEYIRQFQLGQNSFLHFPAGFFFCNGTSCGQHFEFLYHFNTKQLYVFDLYRGRGHFGDANGDQILDYLEIRPKDSWNTLDTISARFYTLNTQRRLFEPLKNEKGEDAIIWLKASNEDDRNDYRFGGTLTVINL